MLFVEDASFVSALTVVVVVAIFAGEVFAPQVVENAT